MFLFQDYIVCECYIIAQCSGELLCIIQQLRLQLKYSNPPDHVHGHDIIFSAIQLRSANCLSSLVLALPRLVPPLTISLGGIIAIHDDQVLRPVVMSPREVRVQDVLGALSVSLLRIDTGTRHVGNHGIPSTEGVLGVAERVVLGCWLREPDVTSVATKVAGFQGLGDVFLDDNGAASGVDEP